jgi:hypothetical protein
MPTPKEPQRKPPKPKELECIFGDCDIRGVPKDELFFLCDPHRREREAPPARPIVINQITIFNNAMYGVAPTGIVYRYVGDGRGWSRLTMLECESISGAIYG